MSANPDSIIDAVIKTITVACTPAEAFKYFTADMDKWWPLATHSCIAFASEHKKQPESCTFEQHQGGRIVERGSAGEEHIWGTVLAWEPPARVAFTWHPGHDPAEAQTVEVTFSETADGTEVVLMHSGFERLGEMGAKAREGYNMGWEGVFVTAFANYARSNSK